MHDKLKSCPFCGGKASAYEVVTDTDKDFAGYIVCCNDCGCATTAYDFKDDAMLCWNKRDYELCDKEMLNLLKFILDSWDIELDMHSKRMKVVMAAKELLKAYED